MATITQWRQRFAEMAADARKDLGVDGTICFNVMANEDGTECSFEIY